MREQTALEAVMLAAQTILESGGETYRAEETASRMCEAFGLSNAQIISFPTGLFVNVVDSTGHAEGRIARVTERSIRLRFIDQVNDISRRVVSGELDADAAHKALTALRASPRPSQWLMIMAFALSAGFFAIMFGGGMKEFVMAAALGALAQAMTPLFTMLKMPLLMSSLISAVVLASCGKLMIVLFSGMQEPVITGSIMPLLPGLSMTNAIRDTMRGDLVSGMARGFEALAIAVMVAAGVAAALMLWR